MLITLDTKSSIPIYVQLRNQIVTGIGRGELKAGESLPTVRQLAADAGVNTMTVNKTYQLLKADGYIFTDRRNGATVQNVFPDVDHLSERDQEQLAMIISRASLSGINKEQFLELCGDIYDQLISGNGR